MPLINCKVELKLKWTRYCVLSATGADNNNGNDNNIIFTIKGTKLYVPVVTLSARKNSQNFFAKDLKDQSIGMKQKKRIKMQQMNLDIFLNQILLESIDYLY